MMGLSFETFCHLCLDQANGRGDLGGYYGPACYIGPDGKHYKASFAWNRETFLPPFIFGSGEIGTCPIRQEFLESVAFALANIRLFKICSTTPGNQRSLRKT